ncbi:hypothetical protein FLJC2902T_16850 [Flavobacterium limnosediminis JC2902]|uniref:Uncharacterized protein n=1 Tax=Flavobacterium limnosediminis JC2902 TaxID=1341181 RepID=V6SPG8_9FLAO|nr:hypothetical protein FLJC2902T_16850 [Flavobacterium limnosediminis JC2902]
MFLSFLMGSMLFDLWARSMMYYFGLDNKKRLVVIDKPLYLFWF